MITTHSTFKDFLALLKNSGRTDFQAISSTVTNPSTYVSYIKVHITFLEDDSTLTVKFEEPTWAGEEEHVLSHGQEEIINQINQMFKPKPKAISQAETDWNLRKIKFVFGEINSWSKDPSTRVSAALFNGKYQICSSYNGFPPGVKDTPERLNDRPLKYKLVQHAEANLISTCARLGIRTEGMSVVVTLFPCSRCAGQLVAAGIQEVITVEPSDEIKTRWGEDFELAKAILDEGNVKITIVKYTPHEN